MTIEPLPGTSDRSDPRLRFVDGAQHHGLAVQRLLDEPTIRITGAANEWRHQALLLVLVDLLDRLFPRIDIAVDTTVPSAGSLPPGPAQLADRLAATRDRSPLAPQAPGAATITVRIGPGPGHADIHVDASEWQSYLGAQPSRLGPPRCDSAVGPFIAACRAAARIFDTLLHIEHSALPDGTYSSALTYRHAKDPLDDPEAPAPGELDALLVGAGSVGGAAGSCLALEPHVAGRLVVCDPQCLEERNPYRAILATAASAERQAEKAAEVRAALDHHHGLAVDPHRLTITQWEAVRPEPARLPLVLVAVDTFEDRERVQDALPIEVVNAAVEGHLVAVSGHRFGKGACMCCLHMPQTLDSRSIKNRLIANATNIAFEDVNRMRVRSELLEPRTISRIEQFRGLQRGALKTYIGQTVDALYDAELVYGEAKVTTDGGSNIAVAAPFATALAGAFLAAEALKRSTPELAEFALGPDGLGIQYVENLHTPDKGFIDPIFTVPVECLCQSARRRRLTEEIYGCGA